MISTKVLLLLLLTIVISIPVYATLPDISFGTGTTPNGSYLVQRNINVNASIWCYQESANITNQTGIDSRNCNLQYNGTYELYNDPGHNYSYLYINYTKPLWASNQSLWQVMYGPTASIVNITIPQSCWNYNPNTISLRIGSSSDDPTGNQTSFPQCYNGTWNTIGTRYTISGGGASSSGGGAYKMYDGDWTFVNLAFDVGGAYWSWEASDWSNTISGGGNTLYATIFEEAMWWYIPINARNDTNGTIISLYNTTRVVINDRNLSIASSCWNYNNNTLAFRINNTPELTTFSCYNGSGYTTLYNVTLKSTQDYNVSLWWNMSMPSCYQEFANQSTVCGGVGTGAYGTSESSGEVYINYTKPLGNVMSGSWNIKYGPSITTNVTIPELCWAQSPLQLKMYSNNGASPNVVFSCYNGSGFQNLVTSSLSGGANPRFLSTVNLTIDGNYGTGACFWTTGGVGPNNAWVTGGDVWCTYSFIYEEGMNWIYTFTNYTALPTNTSLIYINYTKPINATNTSLWNIKINDNTPYLRVKPTLFTDMIRGYNFEGLNASPNIIPDIIGNESAIATNVLISSAYSPHSDGGRTESSPPFDAWMNASYINVTRFTISFWVYERSASASGYFIWNGQYGDINKYAADFGMDLAGGVVNAWVGTGSTTYTVSGTSFGTNQLRHFVFTYNGTELVLYENGRKVANNSLIDNIAVNNYNPGGRLLISKTPGVSLAAINEADYDDIYFWNRSLSASEVEELYHTTYINNRTDFNFRNLTNGKYYYDATLYDLTGASIFTPTWESDIVGPFNISAYNVLFKYGGGEYVNDQTYYIIGNSTDAYFNQWNFTLDNQENISTQANQRIDYTVVTDGAHYASIIARDDALSTYSWKTYYYIDNTMPIISFSTPSTTNGFTNKNYIYFNVSINDMFINNVTMQVYNTTGLYSSITIPYLSNDGLIGHWDFERNTSTQIINSMSGPNLTFTTNFNISTVYGKYGKGGVLIISSSTPTLSFPQLNASRPYTICSWYYFTADGNPIYNYRISESEFYIRTNSFEANTTHTTLTYLTYGGAGGAGTNTVNAPKSAEYNKYNYLCIRQQYISEINGQLQYNNSIWVNGVMKASIISQNRVDLTPNPGIGTANVGGNVAGHRIDELRVYNRSLSDAEMKNLYDYNPITMNNSYNPILTPDSMRYNITNLTNGVYYFNATITDFAGQSNTTETRNILLIDTFQNQSYTVTFPYPNNAYTNNPLLNYGFTTIDPYYDYVIYSILNYATNTTISKSSHTLPSFSGYCYQEFTNQNSSCGLDTGVYGGSGGVKIDGDWNTHSGGNTVTYMNYTKPVGATNASLWQVKVDEIYQVVTNYSIPAACWEQEPLQLRVNTAVTPAIGQSGYCWNGITWLVVYNYQSGGLPDEFYEEGMYWYITTPLNYSTTLSDGRYYYDLRIYDKAGNLGYYDPNITIDTISPSISFTNNSTQNNSVLSYPNIFIQVSVNDTNINYTLINLYSNGSVCYQEQANVSTGCGGLNTGSYLSDGQSHVLDDGEYALFDGDYNSKTHFYVSRYYYVNYTIPSNTYNAISQARWWHAGIPQVSWYTNNTIPLSCLNQSILQLRFYRGGAGNDYVLEDCYNNSGWYNIYSNYTGGVSGLYEEAIYWNLSERIINTTLFYGNGVHSINYTNILDGVYYFNAVAYDNASNYNTTPTWYTIMDAVKDNLLVTAHEIITNNTLSYNITFYVNNTYYTSIPSTGQTTTFSILYNNYSNVQVLSNGYVGCNYGSWNATNNYVFPTCEFTNHQLNITMYNSYTNAFINNITSILSTGAYNYTNTQSATNGRITHNIAQGLSYNITLAPPEYLNRTIEYNATGMTASRNLSANQSLITINFLHAISGELINNANITMNDTLYAGKTFNTTTGIVIFNPNTGVHNLTISIPRYTITRYSLTIANQDVRTINITLFPILNLSLYDEKASAINLTYFNFSKPNQMKYTLFCEDDTTIQYIIPNNTAVGPYNINSTCDFGKIRFDLQYNNIDGSTTLYHRILVLPATINLFDFKVFIPELSTTTIVQTFLKPYDIFGIYTIEADTQVRVTKLMPSGVELMIADYMDAEGKITAYLIQGDSYIITILANGVPAKILGPYNADTEGTKILRLFDVVLVSNATMKEGTTTATSQFYELSTNQSLLTLSYRDYANYTSSLTMTIYNGSCDDIGNMLISTTLDYEDLNTSGYDADMSWNVLGSRYMNHSSNVQFCAIHNVTYWDGTTASRRVSHVYDSWIPRPGQFDNPWTFPWIVMLILVVIALGLNARTVSFGSLLIVALAAILYAWNWISTGAPGVLSSVIVGVSLLIAIMFALKRNVT